MIESNVLNHKKSYVPVDSRSKFLLFIVSNLIMFNRPEFQVEWVYISLIMILFCNSFQFGTALKLGALYAALLLGDAFTVANLNGPSGVIALTIVRVFRLYIPIAMTFVYLIKTTTVSEFVAAFRSMRFPEAFIISFSVMFRFFPTLSEKWRNVKNAMGYRGIKVGLVSMLLHPFITLEYILVPLLMSCAKTANELTAASLARGLAVNSNRTCYLTVKFRWIDFVISILALILTGLVLLK